MTDAIFHISEIPLPLICKQAAVFRDGAHENRSAAFLLWFHLGSWNSGLGGIFAFLLQRGGLKDVFHLTWFLLFPPQKRWPILSGMGDQRRLAHWSHEACILQAPPPELVPIAQQLLCKMWPWGWNRAKTVSAAAARLTRFTIQQFRRAEAFDVIIKLFLRFCPNLVSVAKWTSFRCELSPSVGP